MQGEVFATVGPAATLVEVSALVRPDLLLEIEVDAIISSGELPSGSGPSRDNRRDGVGLRAAR